MAYGKEVKNKAFSLRYKGYSLSEISKTLRISKATASFWVGKLNLSESAVKRLKSRQIVGQQKTVETKRAKKQEFIKQLEKEKSKEIDSLPKEKLIYKIIAATLFWCEGGKKENSRLSFINSDPKMVKLFLKCLRKGFKIDENKFRVLIHVHSYHNESDQIKFWSLVTKIPKSQFNRCYRKRNGGKRIRIDYQGCASIRYYDSKLATELRCYYQTLEFL